MKQLLPVVLTLWVTRALAAPDAGAPCQDVEARLAETRHTLTACTDTSRTLATARERCEGELRDSHERQQSNATRLEACLGASDQRCRDAALFAASLLQGSVRAAGACVPADTQRQLQELLDAYGAVSRGLLQLDEYATGASDTLPRVAGTSEPERHLARLLAAPKGAPLWNRRLLIAAFKLTAPITWARLKAKGPVAVDAFFASAGPLPEAFIDEARAEHPEPPGPAGPPLTAALRLTLAYLELSNCDERVSPPECSRARQIVELLDTTGPLIVRRRVEEMWATPCAGVNADTVRAWLQDFPVSQRENAQGPLGELAAAARSKLFLCFLADLDGADSYRTWATQHLPAATTVPPRAVALVDRFAGFVHDGDPLDRCARAVRALQHVQANGCGLERPEAISVISRWSHPQPPAVSPPELEACQHVASLLWSGATVTIADDFSHPPSPQEMVKVDRSDSPTELARLRAACDERRGRGEPFEKSLVALASIARDRGEPVGTGIWRLDATGTLPAEQVRYQLARPYAAWVSHQLNRDSACEALGLPAARCEQCLGLGPGSRYDCDALFELMVGWASHRRYTWLGAGGLLALLAFASWLARERAARRRFGAARRSAGERFEGLGLEALPDPWRFVLPTRHDLLRLALPKTPAWERWGSLACAVIAPDAAVVREADVNHAAAAALREDTRVVFLLHDDDALPDLGAVRATLDWAARGGAKAVQVLLVPSSRLAWATRDEDLLDLVETTTLRGNPFEVRGPVRSSSQFWNRERLVAGLLTEARAGNWVVVTGLRRFGKSSLALEVARRTPGPTAYVDLAGFHHEVAFGETPAVAVEAILRTLVMRLADSATAQFPAATVPAAPQGQLDAPTLAAWLRQLALACSVSSGTAPPPMVLVLDELEQLLSANPQTLGRALDVLSTLAGRLRSAASEPSSPHTGHTVGVLLCGALHPLLWAPLATLGGQSLMGAFPSICVPALDDDAAHAMMRGLGARQGIRFEDEALEILVKASHGVPLLLRRLGTSVLELFDSDRARHGALGAMRIGVEGAREAVRREEQEGSPLRVWVESEIAQAGTSAGVLLRALAQADQVSAGRLQQLVEAQVLERFEASGLKAHLPPAELTRRAQEAATVTVRILAQTRLLEAHGDLTAPEAFTLPDGVLRRILKASRSA
ncbi:MAG: ATP-binding protein [Archangiaceae bacterium]|nr:ATP-binding protein [Archangiaceae bacterium]